MEVLGAIVLLAFVAYLATVYVPSLVEWVDELDARVTSRRDRFNEDVTRAQLARRDLDYLMRERALYLDGLDLDDDSERRARRRAFRAGSQIEPK
jgi:hypothetical protein